MKLETVEESAEKLMGDVAEDEEEEKDEEEEAEAGDDTAVEEGKIKLRKGPKILRLW